MNSHGFRPCSAGGLVAQAVPGLRVNFSHTVVQPVHGQRSVFRRVLVVVERGVSSGRPEFGGHRGRYTVSVIRAPGRPPDDHADGHAGATTLELGDGPVCHERARAARMHQLHVCHGAGEDHALAIREGVGTLAQPVRSGTHFTRRHGQGILPRTFRHAGGGRRHCQVG